MKRHYLQVTFRKGKPFAAYLYLSRRSGVRVARTVAPLCQGSCRLRRVAA